MEESALDHLLQSKVRICSYPPKKQTGQREYLYSLPDQEVNDQW